MPHFAFPTDGLPAAGSHPVWRRLPNLRFFTVSWLVHAALVVLAGSIVLFHNAKETPHFTAGDCDSFLVQASEAPDSQPPSASSASQMPTFTPPAMQAEAPPISAIVSTAPAAGFSLPAATVTGISNSAITAQLASAARVARGSTRFGAL